MFEKPGVLPTEPSVFDYSNNLSKGVEYCVFPANNSAIDYFNRGKYIASVGSNPGVSAFNKYGRYIKCTADEHSIPIQARTFGSTEEFTITWLASKTTTTGNDGMVLGDTGNISNFLWMTSTDTTVRIRKNGGDTNLTIASVSHADYVWRTIRSTNSAITYHANGLKASAGSSAFSLLVNAVTAGYSTRTFDLTGNFGGVIIHGRGLTDNEIIDLHNDPFQLLKPTVQYINFGLPAAANGFQTAWARGSNQVIQI